MRSRCTLLRKAVRIRSACHGQISRKYPKASLPQLLLFRAGHGFFAGTAAQLYGRICRNSMLRLLLALGVMKEIKPLGWRSQQIWSVSCEVSICQAIVADVTPPEADGSLQTQLQTFTFRFTWRYRHTSPEAGVGLIPGCSRDSATWGKSWKDGLDHGGLWCDILSVFLFIICFCSNVDAVAQVGVVLGPGLAGLIAPWGVFMAQLCVPMTRLMESSRAQYLAAHWIPWAEIL